MNEGRPDLTSAAAAERAWSRVRDNLRASAGARLFDQWLKPMELVAGDEVDTVRLALPSPFMTNWVRNHYADRLALEFRTLLPAVRSVVIETRGADAVRVLAASPVEAVAQHATVAPIDAALSSSQTAAVAPTAPAPVALASTASAPNTVIADEPVTPRPRFGTDLPAPAPATQAANDAPNERPVLDPRFTFERFVVDASNRVAFNAARALAEAGVPRFSPLFLHAGTGQGKTHLMHAIAHAFLDHTPGARVLCMSAERFMFEFVSALRARDTFAFKQRLRGCDLLLIDDLQFIAGKDATQEEFFHTVNEVMAAGKRIVITADRCPQALDGIEPRIVGRLGAGLVADIRPAELALRRAILERKLVDLPHAAVPAEVLDLLAGRIHQSIRELEGALNRVVAYAQLTGETIDLDFAVVTLGDVLRGAQRRVTIDEIQKLVSRHFDLKPLDLVSARRARAVARPRQIAMYLAKRLTTRSLPEIGRKFGGRDHSTVIHAVRRVEELRDQDRDIDAAVRTLMRELEG